MADRETKTSMLPSYGKEMFMSWWCRFGFHRWGSWGEKFRIPGAQYLCEYQQRRCARCGKIDERTI